MSNVQQVQEREQGEVREVRVIRYRMAVPWLHVEYVDGFRKSVNALAVVAPPWGRVEPVLDVFYRYAWLQMTNVLEEMLKEAYRRQNIDEIVEVFGRAAVNLRKYLDTLYRQNVIPRYVYKKYIGGLERLAGAVKQCKSGDIRSCYEQVSLAIKNLELETYGKMYADFESELKKALLQNMAWLVNITLPKIETIKRSGKKIIRPYVDVLTSADVGIRVYERLDNTLSHVLSKIIHGDAVNITVHDVDVPVEGFGRAVVRPEADDYAVEHIAGWFAAALRGSTSQLEPGAYMSRSVFKKFLPCIAAVYNDKVLVWDTFECSTMARDNGIKLRQRGVHSLRADIYANNNEIVVLVSGDTYPLREYLKRGGFYWERLLKKWKCRGLRRNAARIGKCLRSVAETMYAAYDTGDYNFEKTYAYVEPLERRVNELPTDLRAWPKEFRDIIGYMMPSPSDLLALSEVLEKIVAVEKTGAGKEKERRRRRRLPA